MKSYYRVLVPRLNGEEIVRNFSSYRSLVKKGVAGFIVFGGRLAEVRRHVARLQDEADMPLIIASDLERGLGQQLKGGTPFPPAMALARAARRGRGGAPSYDLALFGKVCSAVAEEAAYAGINTIFAPVLDVNTNPKNPIIAQRAFGEDATTVSLLGREMIRVFQSHGIAACGKHFPGHGDTEVDSHISLPVIGRRIAALEKTELRPFREAAAAGVKMIMLGHLKVPALDPAGVPVTLSSKAVSFLRKKLNFDGIAITDAMNMGGIAGYSEEEASFMALAAGVDVILHPSDANGVAAYLRSRKTPLETDRLDGFRRGLLPSPAKKRPDFGQNGSLSRTMTERALTVSGSLRLKGRPCLVVLNDEEDNREGHLVRALRKGLPGLKVVKLAGSSGAAGIPGPEGLQFIAAVFSETRGWKGGAGGWLRGAMSRLAGRDTLFISFGSPYLLEGVESSAKIFAYWDSPSAQDAVARLLSSRAR